MGLVQIASFFQELYVGWIDAIIRRVCSNMMNDDVLQPCTKQHFEHRRRV